MNKALQNRVRIVFGPRPTDADIEVLRRDLENAPDMMTTERRQLLADRIWCVHIFGHPRFEDLSGVDLAFFRRANLTRIKPRGSLALYVRPEQKGRGR